MEEKQNKITPTLIVFWAVVLLPLIWGLAITIEKSLVFFK